MSWQADVSVWADKPDSIQVFSDDGREVDYVPERTCRNTQSDFDFMCSECGKCVDNGRVLGINYCPNCGAKVIGG